MKTVFFSTCPEINASSNRKVSNCKTCGEPIFFRYVELYEKLNHGSMLQWRRTLIKTLGWMAFDVENPALIHRHKYNKSRHAGPGSSKSEVAA